MADTEADLTAAGGQPKRRTFRKFSFRGVDLDALLDMSTDELVKLFTARARRRFQRGLKRKPMALIKKLRKALADLLLLHVVMLKKLFVFAGFRQLCFNFLAPSQFGWCTCSTRLGGIPLISCGVWFVQNFFPFHHQLNQPEVTKSLKYKMIRWEATTRVVKYQPSLAVTARTLSFTNRPENT